MKQNQAIRASRGTRAPHSPALGGRSLETEIAELREVNVHLRRRLEEVELRAEFQAAAHRLLAIPFSPRE